MEEKLFIEKRERTETKLRFAQIHLQELGGLDNPGGDDFERAHQESFLYHLLGAKDAFILELNIIYNANLPEQNLSPGKLQKILDSKGKKSSELSELYELEKCVDSWLFHARIFRDQVTHFSAVPRAYYLGGKFDHQIHLKNHKTEKIIKRHYVDLFSDWLLNMKELLNRLRSSAVKNNPIFSPK
jgi:hypothetical protein